ncbi:MAG: hypothetical protein RML32_04065 [Gammaproteobacteria bacterium]|nr:hypothetical protein [Gammaproteobacteria bacterium]
MARDHASSILAQLEDGTLSAEALVTIIPQMRAARATFVQGSQLAGLQAYARQAISMPSFDLAAEASAVINAMTQFIVTAAAAFNAAQRAIDNAGEVRAAKQVLAVSDAPALRSACMAVLEAIQ